MADYHERKFVDWVKGKAAALNDENVYEAKSWLLTGASIYPNNISMKMMCYKLAKQDHNVVLCCSHLTTMLGSSSSDSHAELQEEIQLLLRAVQMDTPTSVEDKINAEIFRNLPNDVQCKVLKRLSSTCEDVIRKCSLLLLLIKTNQSYAKECGILLIESLFQAEMNESPHTIRNVYRKYFVSDVLPLMLQDNPTGTDKKILLGWLDKAFQYYVVSAFHSQKEGIMSPTGSKTPPHGSIKEARPWESLAALLLLTGQQIKVWEISAEHFLSDESLVHYLSTLKQRLSKDYSKTMKREFIYIGTYHLLKQVHAYNALKKKMKPMCLVQRVFDKISPKKGKKSTASSGHLTLAAANNIQHGESLVSTFNAACNIWALLHNDSIYAKGFMELLTRLDHAKWRSILSSFNRDRIVYHKEYKDYPIANDAATDDGYYALQKACCQFALGMHQDACHAVLSALTRDIIHSDNLCKCRETWQSSEGNVQFLFVSHPKDLFDSGIIILMSALKECLDDSANDEIIGDLCVLCQSDWLKHKDIFLNNLIPRIVAAKTFKYPCFFDYITNTEMLEEFAYLHTEQGGNINLQILAMNIPKPRTVTRGVSRFAQEDFKAAFEKQILRSSECVQGLIVRFLIERRNELLSRLS
ncbi:integrator complex subunit 10-like [Watersipora subatra]|uniref:integrator complex subunit 10-like n=1 Tax=Watersipora subatra TaxID=2589382 RepID=UPI00355C46E6